MMRDATVSGVSAVRVFVSDLAHAVAFYRDTLGLAAAGTDDHAWARFVLPNAALLVEAVDRRSSDFHALVGRFVGVSLETDDIGAAYERLSKLGVRFDGPPEKQFWGGTLAHFHDPDGNVWTLSQAREHPPKEEPS